MASMSSRIGRLLGVAAALCLLCAWASVSRAGAAEPPSYRFSFGPDGTGSTDFEAVGSIAVDQTSGAVYVIDRAAGVLYKFDEEGIPTGEITGLSFFPRVNESQVAVDSTSHILYVTSSNSILAFDETGDPATFSAGPGAGTNQISGFGELIGVAVDANGNIYTSDYTGHIRIYEPGGAFLTEFETSTPANLAVAPDGTVYVSRYSGPVFRFTPSPGPITASTTYTAAPDPLDPYVSQTVSVDPTTGNVYVAELFPDFSYTRVVVYDPSGTFVTSFGGQGEEGELANSTGGVAVEGSTGQVFVSTEDGSGATARSQVEVFSPAVIFEGKPSIVGSSVSEVTGDTAVLQGSINPNTAETSSRFEYGTSNCAATPGSCVVVPGSSIGSGHQPVGVSQPIDGLQPGTTYYYRVVAVNSFGATEGPMRTFTTQGSGLGFELSDSRAWELVSPPDKHGGVIVSSSAGTIQAAEDGQGVVYQSRGSIEGEPSGNRATEPSTVLAQHSSDGWTSKDITLPHSTATNVAAGTEYDLFTPDLGRAALEPRDATPLSPMSSERTPYLRENSEPPVYTPLVTSKEGFANVPAGTKFGGNELQGQVSEVIVAGANRDLSHVVLASKVPLVAGAPSGGGGRSLYQWYGGTLHVVSGLPAEDGGGIVKGVLGADQGSVRNAISSDGLRVFWSTGSLGTGSNIGLTGLYLRDTAAGQTTRLDIVQPGVTEEGDPHPVFQDASADGTVVFFTDSQRLTANASLAGRDLYRCEIPAGAAGCTGLTDISAPRSQPGESAEVRGVVLAASEDGTRVYFVASGILDARPNSAGDSATLGEPNLYLWQEGEGSRFLVRLSEEDSASWGMVNNVPPGYTSLLSSAGSPSGRYLAFMSERSLAGEDNEDAASGEPVERVFRYDAVSDRLACVSCDPSSARPQGRQDPPRAVDVQGLWQGRLVSATMPESTVSAGDQTTRYTVYQPRTVLDDGRVFFNASEGLVSADSNSDWDVYQYEPIGVGSCSASTSGAAVARSVDGCVSLLSSGTAEGASSFLDASASGDDVFFLTAGRLSVTDEDTVVDVYDARVGGSAATLNPATECVGDACRPPGTAPGDVTPAAESFHGPGNTITRRCPKGKGQVHRHGKTQCVRRKRHRHRHKHTRHKHGAHHRGVDR